MKTMRFGTKIVVALCGILLIVSVLAAHAASPTAKTLQDVLDAIATLQNTVNNMPPSWYQTLPSDRRFLLVMGGAAVLDRETGLVWEQSPSTSTFPWSSTRTQTASAHCASLRVGNRMGWRLPTMQELASLVDPSVAPPGPTLPAGHPFSNVQSSTYWSATTSAEFTGVAWVVDFSLPDVFTSGEDFDTLVWCVRGGQGVDPQ